MNFGTSIMFKNYLCYMSQYWLMFLVNKSRCRDGDVPETCQFVRGFNGKLLEALIRALSEKVLLRGLPFQKL